MIVNRNKYHPKKMVICVSLFLRKKREVNKLGKKLAIHRKNGVKNFGKNKPRNPQEPGFKIND